MARAIPWLPLIALMGLLSVALEVQAQSAAPLDALDPRQGIAAALAPHAGKPVSTARLDMPGGGCSA